MLTIEDLKKVLTTIETDRIEKTETLTNTDKFGEAICAFSNDLPDNRESGYLIIGVSDDNALSNANITDEFLRKLSDFAYDGRVQPKPTIFVNRCELDGNQLAVVEVVPSKHAPVRFNGNIYVRTSARKGKANESDERRLIEKRTANARTFDSLPCWEAEIDGLALDLVKLSYFPLAIDREILEANHRDTKQQLASLRLYDTKHDKPTNAGILLFGLNTLYFLQGAYIEYIKIKGTDKGLDNVERSKTFNGALYDMLKEIDVFINDQIVISKPVRLPDSFQDAIMSNYPRRALREFVMNAIMHRDYESNAPIYIYHYDDKIEIHNAGYLYGGVNKDNFPHTSDYRNPTVAEAMKNLGYVNRFNFGIQDAQNSLKSNGSPPAEFDLNLLTKIVVTVNINPSWQSA